jgi:pentatricopeptide repeat protein
LIEGYARQGRGHRAFDCFDKMLAERHRPNSVTFVSALKACGITRAIDTGRRYHGEVVRRGLLEQNDLLSTSLVDMYVKCGSLAEAWKVHERICTQDVVSWSALITGYAQQGQGKDALDCFEMMQNEGVHPNAVTLACILKACGSIGAVDSGKRLHEAVASMGLLEKDVVLCTALVDMYAKCGILTKAQQVHNEFSVRTEASWNALITGYAQQGQGHEALACFRRMQGDGISPNPVTFLCMLKACSRSGLLDVARTYFEDMNKKCSIAPTFEHYTCMMMVFACAGHFDKAWSMIEMMPSCDYSPLWLALLGACSKWGNVKMGRLAFDHVVQLNRSCAAAYTIISNIHAGSEMGTCKGSLK